MTQVLVLIVAIATGVAYFVLELNIWLLVALFLLTLATRFRRDTKNLGKFVQMLFVFCLTSTAIDTFKIHYPYSMILVLSILVVLIFYEGPQWGELFFGIGKTPAYFKQSLALTAGLCLMFGLAIYFNRGRIQNPLPVGLPIDVLLVLGVGFAFYRAVVEEIIFRSFIFERANSAGGMTIAVAAQAAFFGLMYYKVGVPGHVQGVILGSLFGLALGYLVKKSESIYLSMLVHFIVTLFIFFQLTILGKLQIL